jgi:hypothetical protein
MPQQKKKNPNSKNKQSEGGFNPLSDGINNTQHTPVLWIAARWRDREIDGSKGKQTTRKEKNKTTDVGREQGERHRAQRRACTTRNNRQHPDTQQHHTYTRSRETTQENSTNPPRLKGA